MKNNEEINEEYIRKMAREYFNNSIRTELDSAIIFKYIKDLEDRLNKAIEYIEVLYTRYIADYSDIERLEKILKGEENENN